MCEFVTDHVDLKTMSETQKEKLRNDLESRKKELQKRIDALETAIQKVK